MAGLTVIEGRGQPLNWYLPLKLVHVVSAIVAVGTNVTYFVWLAAMKDQVVAENSRSPSTRSRSSTSAWRTRRTASSH